MKNPITFVDHLLVSKVFQPVVDASQRQPAWWARQSVLMSGVALVVLGCAYGWHWLLAIALLSISLVALFTFSDGVIAILGTWWGLRVAMLLWTVVLWALLAFILPAFGGAQWLRTLFDVSQLALLYFAACRPPAPPKTRTSTKRAFA